MHRRYDENVGLLKDTYKTEIEALATELEARPSKEAREKNERQIHTLVEERSQMQSAIQAQEHQLKELKFILRQKEEREKELLAAAKLQSGVRRRSTDNTAAGDVEVAPAPLPAKAQFQAEIAIAQLEKKLAAKDQQVEKSSQELSALKDDFETLQQEFRFREGQSKKLVEDLAAESKRVAEYELKLSAALERAESLEESIRRQQEVIDSVKRAGEEKASDANRLLIESVEDNTRLRREVDRLQSGLDRTEAQLREAQAEQEVAQQALAQSQKEARDFMQMLDEAQAFGERLKETIKAREQEVKAARTQLAESTLTLESVTRERDDLVNDVSAGCLPPPSPLCLTCPQVERLRDEIDDLKQYHESELGLVNGKLKEAREELERRKLQHAEMVRVPFECPPPVIF